MYNNSKNVAIESLFVKTNVRDQSNKELAKFANNLFPLLFALLNVGRQLKHNGIMFQISKVCLPAQFVRPNIRSIMLFSEI